MLEHCQTQDMPTYLMTKPITAVLFDLLRSKLEVVALKADETTETVVRGTTRVAAVYRLRGNRMFEIYS